MKKKDLLKITTTLMLSVSLLLAGCGGESKPAGGGAKNDGAPKIAVAVPLTGASAEDGNSIKNGVTLAVNEINAKGGIKDKKVEVVFEDDKGDPSEAATVANKLAQDTSISAIVGNFNSSCTLASAPIYNQAGVVTVSPGSSAAAVTDAGPFVFRVITTDAVQGKAVMEWATQKLGYKNIAVMYENTDYGNGVSDIITKTSGDYGAKVVANEAYEVGATDFSTALTKIANANPDVLIIGGLYNETALIAKQKQNFGLEKLQIMGVDAIFSDALVKLGGQAAEGIKMTGYFSENSTDPVSANFVKEYQKAYNKTPSTYAAYGYDAALFLLEAMKNVGTDRKAICEYLPKIKDMKGATGSGSFDANGDIIKQPLYIIIKDGKFVVTDK